ncbi:MAG: MATE family efflux transporter, partial [Clostridia bacterium]|nr:MATE family efflux transporter [Clostridia bacterium]
AGDTKSVFIITAMSMWGVRALGATICVRLLGMGIYSVVTCMCIENVVRMLLFARRYHQNKWKEAANKKKLA